jgi:hypothetical protein
MPEIVGHGAGQRTQRFSLGLRAPDRAPFMPTALCRRLGTLREETWQHESATCLNRFALGSRWRQHMEVIR